MSAKSVVLFVHSGNCPVLANPNSTLALPSSDRVLPRSARCARADHIAELLALSDECRQVQLWETVTFATLGMCGVATTAFAFLRFAAS
jgi:hypothetical protein